MALTNGDITKAWKSWLKAVLNDQRACQWNKEELKQAIQAVDAWAEANAAEYNAALPAFIRTGARAASTDEKGALLAAVIIMRMAPAFRRQLIDAMEVGNG